MKLPSFLRRVQIDDNYNVVEVSVATRVRRVLFGILVLVVNVLIIIRATVSCDISLSDAFLLSPRGGRDLAAAALSVPKPSSLHPAVYSVADSARLYRLHAASTTDELGNLHLKHVKYVDGAELLEFTLRQNLRNYPLNEDGEPNFACVVRVATNRGVIVYCEDETGRDLYRQNQALAYESIAMEYYKASFHTVTEMHRGYAHTRFAYEELPVDLENDYVVLYVYDIESGKTLLASTLVGTGAASSPDDLRSQTYRDL